MVASVILHKVCVVGNIILSWHNGCRLEQFSFFLKSQHAVIDFAWTWIFGLAYPDAFVTVMLRIMVMLTNTIFAFGDALVVALRADI